MAGARMEVTACDPCYITLYRLGGIAGILSAVAIVLAIAAYFIWPYTGNTTSIAAILSMLQTDRLGGLISLDVSMLLIAPITLVMFLGLYAALRRVDESIALIAVALALLAVGLIFVCRPLVELVALSDQYAAATDAVEQMRNLAAGEVLRTQLDGTAWAMQTIFLMHAGLLNSSLMLRAGFFSKATARLGIVISAVGLGFFLPTAGLIFLFLNTIRFACRSSWTSFCASKIGNPAYERGNQVTGGGFGCAMSPEIEPVLRSVAGQLDSIPTNLGLR